MSEEDELQRALALSTGLSEGDHSDITAALQNPELLGSILSSLPGVDPNDPRIKSALGDISGGKKEEEKDKKDKDKEK